MKIKLLSCLLALPLIFSGIFSSYAYQISQEDATNLHFSARDSRGMFFKAPIQKTSEIQPILEQLPIDHRSALKNVILDYNPRAHRGLGRADLIIMRAVQMSKKEFLAVFVHEMGHSVDLGVLKGLGGRKSKFKDFGKPVYENDSSLKFYRISWQDESTRKKMASNEDFVSGYAMTDPFEDFAESYAYYVLHYESFKKQAKSNEALSQKFNFMTELFDGKTFKTGSSHESYVKIPWDITKLDYSMNNLIKK